jgi:hypothetical protein
MDLLHSDLHTSFYACLVSSFQLSSTVYFGNGGGHYRHSVHHHKNLYNRNKLLTSSLSSEVKNNNTAISQNMSDLIIRNLSRKIDKISFDENNNHV